MARRAIDRPGPATEQTASLFDRRGPAQGGEWQRVVVPYRYYGPGYAGVGYYAVYYQGDEGRGQ